MTSATRGAAASALGAFLGDDPHYRANAARYGDGGRDALERALDLFIAQPQIGFVWLALRAAPAGAAPGTAATPAPEAARAYRAVSKSPRAIPDVPGAVPDAAPEPRGASVVCRAISTSRGSLVAKLDDVTIAPGWQGRGVGAALLQTLAARLREEGVRRVDTSCHRDNGGAWRFYERLGFQPLDEERLALLL
jgi:ribosomal protein S18 acetylase RimI-like enzyme